MGILLHEKEVAITSPDGTTKTYILSKFPATVGREICTQYPIAAIPRLGDYGRNEELMLKMMCYVGIPDAAPGGEALLLRTEQLVNAHIPDFETLMKIEMAMMEYNCSFFARGKASNFLEALLAKVQVLLTQTLMDFSQRSSKKNTQP
jgi:hypothetical protein